MAFNASNRRPKTTKHWQHREPSREENIGKSVAVASWVSKPKAGKRARHARNFSPLRILRPSRRPCRREGDSSTLGNYNSVFFWLPHFKTISRDLPSIRHSAEVCSRAKFIGCFG